MENTRSISIAVPQGSWKTFPNGSLKNAKGGTVTLKLSDAPVTTQYIRVLMTESSNTCDLAWLGRCAQLRRLCHPGNSCRQR